MLAHPNDAAWIRRRRRQGGSVDPLGAGNTALRAALTDAVLLAWYDFRVGVTASGGLVTSVADVRGAGFGPSLAPTAVVTATTSPAYDSSNGVVTFNASTDKPLISATTSLFDLSLAKTVVYVGTVNVSAAPAATTYFCGINNSAFTTTLVGRVAGSDTHIDAFINTAITGNVLAGATRRVVILTKSAGTTGSIQVPNQAAVSATTTNSASSNLALGIGGSATSAWLGTTNLQPITAAACLVLGVQATPAIVSTLATWATTYRGVTTA